MSKLKIALPTIGAALIALSAVPQFAAFSQVLSGLGTFLVGLSTRRPGDVSPGTTLAPVVKP
jgi:hypothetical protein